MGLVCALVYLLAIIAFLPFAFKRDIVAATSGRGNKDSVLVVESLENGRFLRRFPLEKVRLRGTDRHERHANFSSSPRMALRTVRLLR